MQYLFNSFNKDQTISGKRIILILIFSLLIMLPYLWLGKAVSIPVVDNMDSTLAWYKMLQDQEKFFIIGDMSVYGMLKNTPRYSYPSGYNVESLLYAFLPNFTAYMVNKWMIFIVAYYSFWFWLKGKMDNQIDSNVLLVLPLIWASLAFYPHGGISIAALPLLVKIFSDLQIGKRRLIYWLLLLGYGFYSSLSLGGLYLISGLFCWIVMCSIINRLISWESFGALLLLIGVYIIQDFYLLHSIFFNSDFVSHRVDFSYDFGIWVNQFPWDFFWDGDQNVVHYSPVYTLMIIVLLLFGQHKNMIGKQELVWVWGILGISVFLSLLSFSGHLDFLSYVFPPLASLNLLRYANWIPFFVFAALVSIWLKFSFKYYKLLLPLLLITNVFFYQYEWRYWINQSIPILQQKVPSYRSYFAEEQFQDIKDFIESKGENPVIAHLNIPPAVSAFNGLIAADGYLPFYEKSYKDSVYKGIKNEIEKDVELKQHFLEWGNKCYFQNAQYPDDYFMYKWREEERLREPDFDYDYLKNELQISYFLSALPMDTDQMSLVKVFEDESSAWRVHLYKLND